MSYKTEIEKQQQDIAAATSHADEAAAFFEFYSKNRPEGLISCEANTKLLRDWMGDIKITAQSLQDAYENTSVNQQLAHQRSEGLERRDLVNFIIENRKMQPETEKAERERLMNPRLTAIETVRMIADRVKNRREMETKSVDELREIVKAGQPQTGFQEVPEQYRTKSALLRLANQNITLYKRLMQQCGRAALDAIIQRAE
jgi:hypothetical protein